MRKTRILGVTCALVAIALGHPAAQTARVEGGVRSLTGVDFYWETRLVPPVPPLDDRFAMLTLKSGDASTRGGSPDTVHRVMMDTSRKVYFGYDARVTVVKTESSTAYRIAFGPLSLTPELQQILGNVQAWKLLPAPRFPAPRVVRAGEVLELTLLTNSAWGQQMSEYVTVQAPRRQGFDPDPPREFAFAAGTPRDFSAADIELRLEAPRVTTTYPSADAPQSLPAGGSVRDASGVTTTFESRAEASGPIIWIYLPGRGRFLLSLTPRNAFRRAGEVRGTVLRFIADGQTYDVLSTSRIAPATAAFNLYVLRQPRWKPTYPNANLDTVHIGAADRLEYLVVAKE
jgi:hypothetical protein